MKDEVWKAHKKRLTWLVEHLACVSCSIRVNRSSGWVTITTARCIPDITRGIIEGWAMAEKLVLTYCPDYGPASPAYSACVEWKVKGEP